MKMFVALLGMASAIFGSHYAFSDNVAATIYCCFAAYVCYDYLKEGDCK